MGPLSITHKRIGIVLSGGGAKGAYQIGCWKALRKAGLTNIGGLAGTSVGAINAVLIASDKFEAVESGWRNLRIREILGVKPHMLAWHPIRIVAALVLVFCQSRLRRWSVAKLVLKQKLSLAEFSFLAGSFSTFTSFFVLSGLAFLALLSRIFRQPLIHGPSHDKFPLVALLNQQLTEADIGTMHKAGVPVYVTLSRYRRGKGWVPEYFRLDKLSRIDVINTLLESAGFTRTLAARYLGSYSVDGKWADNVPAAPLLFDSEVQVDVVFVIDIGRRAYPARKFSWLSPSTWGKAMELRLNSKTGEEHELLGRAEKKWRAYNLHLSEERQHLKGPTESSEENAPSSISAPSKTLPSIVQVSPSEPPGNFFWFARGKTKRLMELGEKDMNRVLAEMESRIA